MPNTPKVLSLLVTLWAGPCLAQADYRGEYELHVAVQGAVTSVRGSATAANGDPITQKVGDRLVWMQPHFADNDTYYLVVSALPLRRSDKDTETFQAHTFPGQLRSPLRFDAHVGEGVSVGGSLVVERLGE